MNTEIANAIAATDDEAQYDVGAKRLLAEKHILASPTQRSVRAGIRKMKTSSTDRTQKMKFVSPGRVQKMENPAVSRVRSPGIGLWD